MDRSAVYAYAIAGAASIAAGLLALTPAAAPSPPVSGDQPPAIQLTAGESDLLIGDAGAAQADGYSFTEFINSIQGSIDASQNLFGEAGTDFANGDIPDGTSEALAGFDNLTVGVESDLLVNGYAVLTGDGGYAGLEVQPLIPPSDLAEGLSYAQDFESQANENFTAAMTEFASGNVAGGLGDFTSGDIELSSASDAIILGLIDSLPGVYTFN